MKRNKKEKRFLGLPLKKTLLYGLLFLAGLIFAAAALCPCLATWAHDVLLSLGTGIVASSIVAYFSDLACDKRERKRIRMLRDTFLWGFPIGLLWLMKTIVEFYYPTSEAKDVSLAAAFEESVKNFDKMKFHDDAVGTKRLLSKAEYGINLCRRDAVAILSHESELVINGVFTKDELVTIRFIAEECVEILDEQIIVDLVERFKAFVNEAVRKIEEVEQRVNVSVAISGRRIKNWAKIAS